MKKLSIIFIMIISLVLSTNVMAKTTALDLKNTLNEEGIKLKDTYSESNDQVTIYLFRGQGCSHCEDFLNYLNSIVKTHGKMFKLRSYEVWENSDNNDLREKVVETLKIDANGVPLIIVGKQSFYGFDDDTPKKLEKALKSEYSKKKSDRYDVIKEATELQEKEAQRKKSNSAIILLIPIILIAIIIFLSREPKTNKA